MYALKSCSSNVFHKYFSCGPLSVNPMNIHLLVGNIPLNTSEDGLKEVFNTVGIVQEVVVPRNERGVVRGFATVVLKTPPNSLKEETIDTLEYCGRKLTISILKEEPVSGSSGLLSKVRRFFGGTG